MQVLNVGHSATIVSGKVLAILPWNSAPIKSLKKQAKVEGKFMDATFGKPTRSLIMLDGGYAVASSVLSETLRDSIKAPAPDRIQDDPPNLFQE